MGYGLCRALPGETSSIATLALRMTAAMARSGQRSTTRLDASFGRRDHTISPSADVLAQAFDGWRVLAVEAERGRVFSAGRLAR